MKAKFRVALHAALFNAVVFTFGLLLFPLLTQAGADLDSDIEKAGLVTPQDYVEYASANDIDIHELYFSVILYEGTESCLRCHQDAGEAALEMGHFKWQGKSKQVVGLEGKEIGKNNLINNFCIAVPTNEPRCTQCHAGLGYASKNFNFDDPNNVDCLACHDQSGTYAKDMKKAGVPAEGVDLNLVARSIALGSEPQRKNCINCHAKAGGGDNVKHGDLSTDLIATTRDFDVHMGTDGANFNCVACHAANHDPQTGEVNHGNAGMSLHSVNEGEMRQCSDCHGSQNSIHAGTDAYNLFAEGWHERLACQVCHIPAIARAKPTKVEWYWSDAGQNISPIPTDPDTGMPTYDKKKGTFNWSYNVRPVLRYSNGKFARKVMNLDDKYYEVPIQLAVPQGDYNDPDAMIYPFKKMVGNQPVDPVTGTVMVPHLFGTGSGPNPYWGKYDWGLALQDGANYTGQDYSGTYTFEATEMLLPVNHEIAPAGDALGAGATPDKCMSCHNSDHVDWYELGWSGDPLEGGQRENGPVTDVNAVQSYFQQPAETVESAVAEPAAKKVFERTRASVDKKTVN